MFEKMRNSGRLCAIVMLSVFVCGCVPALADGSSAVRLDVFHEVLEKLNVTGTMFLPETKVELFFDQVLHRFVCNETGTALPEFQAETSLGSCTEELCLNTTDLFSHVGGDVTQGLTEEQFHAAASSALYVLARGQHPCHATLSLTAGGVTALGFRSKLVALVGPGGAVTEDSLEALLHGFEALYKGVEHGHESDKDTGNHAGHDHRRRRRGANDDHGDDDHDDDAKPHVVEEKCLAPDAVMYYINADENDEAVNASSTIDDIAAIIIYQMSQGAAIEEKCRELPKKSAFVTNLVSMLTQVPNANLTKADLFRLMTLLDIVPKESASDDHAGHDHRRRRRSAAARSDVTVSRHRRQAVTTDKKCYSADQLSAVFELGDSITPQQLTQLSPALIYQKLYSTCKLAANATVTMNSDMDRWWYGTLAVVLICACAVMGVLVVPCMARSAYKMVMALFIGLAVGSLAGDALLHLIPATMGAHAHGGEGDGHDHGSGKIVVEEYLWFALVTLVGIYVFFLLETLFTRFLTSNNVAELDAQHGHSHSYEMNSTPDKDAVKLAEESNADKPKSNTSLSVMIILGDAIHNFADGLAIGAAFSSSNSTGIATSIAVFCHELPHELGDFTVLLKNGMTIKQAVFWNVVSALTAFIGLYVSLAVSTSEQVQIWIFAIASGMFLYIALVDLLPTMLTRAAVLDNAIFVMHNVGLLLGALIMLLIAIFEEHIKI